MASDSTLPYKDLLQLIQTSLEAVKYFSSPTVQQLHAAHENAKKVAQLVPIEVFEALRQFNNSLILLNEDVSLALRSAAKMDEQYQVALRSLQESLVGPPPFEEPLYARATEAVKSAVPYLPAEAQAAVEEAFTAPAQSKSGRKTTAQWLCVLIAILQLLVMLYQSAQVAEQNNAQQEQSTVMSDMNTSSQELSEVIQDLCDVVQDLNDRLEILEDQAVEADERIDLLGQMPDGSVLQCIDDGLHDGQSVQDQDPTL